MKVLVVGFPRSGTTMTHGIFNKHPDISQMLYERWLLNIVDNKKQLKNKFPKMVGNFGEKVIWGKRLAINRKEQTIVDYCIEWNVWFGNEAKIIQIIRHPYDTLNSLVISKKRLPRGPKFEKNYSEYLLYAPKYIPQINSLPNCLTVKYENIVTNIDDMTKKIFNHCGLEVNHKHPIPMKINRVFNYKNYKRKKDFLFKYDDRLKNVIEEFNKIDGVKYEL